MWNSVKGLAKIEDDDVSLFFLIISLNYVMGGNQELRFTRVATAKAMLFICEYFMFFKVLEDVFAEYSINHLLSTLYNTK
mgnify:CR=1 FL=1